jgi:two-component sensor histidine kinase
MHLHRDNDFAKSVINAWFSTGSPLHGILAGVELLQDTQLTPFQEEMSLSVALAGRTLLDTVNHILDYSKISNLTRDQKRDRARVDAARHKSAHVEEGDKSLLTVVDLARITEDVVETVVSASRFSKSFDRNSTASSTRLHTPLEGDTVSVVLDIEKRDSWVTPMTPGSWTRVLTNIVGNALKYTPSGLITVKLSSSENRTSGLTSVILSVEDTGIGMSSEFISNDLFVPFRQADSHSAGTGLGLSIVKQVVKEFKGTLNVDSEVGKGSRVSVRFSANFTELPEAVDDGFKGPLDPRAKQLCMLQMAEYLKRSVGPATQSVADSLQRTAKQWLGCDVSASQGKAPVTQGRLCVIAEEELSSLNTIHENGAKNLIDALAESGSSLLVFGRSIASSQPEFDFQGFARKPIYMHQP